MKTQEARQVRLLVPPKQLFAVWVLVVFFAGCKSTTQCTISFEPLETKGIRFGMGISELKSNVGGNWQPSLNFGPNTAAYQDYISLHESDWNAHPNMKGVRSLSVGWINGLSAIKLSYDSISVDSFDPIFIKRVNEAFHLNDSDWIVSRDADGRPQRTMECGGYYLKAGLYPDIESRDAFSPFLEIRDLNMKSKADSERTEELKKKSNNFTP